MAIRFSSEKRIALLAEFERWRILVTKFTPFSFAATRILPNLMANDWSQGFNLNFRLVINSLLFRASLTARRLFTVSFQNNFQSNQLMAFVHAGFSLKRKLPTSEEVLPKNRGTWNTLGGYGDWFRENGMNKRGEKVEKLWQERHFGQWENESEPRIMERVNGCIWKGDSCS